MAYAMPPVTNYHQGTMSHHQGMVPDAHAAHAGFAPPHGHGLAPPHGQTHGARRAARPGGFGPDSCCTHEEVGQVITYVGPGGCYVPETTYKYVGRGAGNFDVRRQSRGCNKDYLWMCGGLCCCLLLTGLLLTWLWPVEPEVDVETPTVQLPHDCNAGWQNWKQGWSPEKKTWCCNKVGRACPPPHPVLPIPPRIPPARPALPVLPVTPAPPGECNIGGVDTWTEEKKANCCKMYGNGCPTPEPAPVVSVPYDCDAGFANWQSGWSDGKKAWCCDHAGRGCVTAAPATTSAPYDCDAGFANWQSGWSDGKKAWCCDHAGRGCVTAAPATTSAPYDCDAGFANWQSGWSVGKKAWCCENVGKGCVTAPGCA